MLLLHEGGRRMVRTKSVVQGLRRQKKNKRKKEGMEGNQYFIYGV